MDRFDTDITFEVQFLALLIAIQSFRPNLLNLLIREFPRGAATTHTVFFFEARSIDRPETAVTSNIAEITVFRIRCADENTLARMRRGTAAECSAEDVILTR